MTPTQYWKLKALSMELDSLSQRLQAQMQQFLQPKEQVYLALMAELQLDPKKPVQWNDETQTATQTDPPPVDTPADPVV